MGYSNQKVTTIAFCLYYYLSPASAGLVFFYNYLLIDFLLEFTNMRDNTYKFIIACK